jgi:hypothetical protein
MASKSASSPKAATSEGLLLWLRAERGVAVEEGRVSECADQSAQHANAFQKTLELRPRLSSGGGFGGATLEFDRTDDYLSLPSGCPGCAP